MAVVVICEDVCPRVPREVTLQAAPGNSMRKGRVREE